MKNILHTNLLPKPVLISSVDARYLDAFDNSDAFFSDACYDDGSPLTSIELDVLTDSEPGRALLFDLACRNFS